LRAQPEPPAERRFGEILEKLIDVLRCRSPSEQCDARRPDHYLILAEFPLKLKPVALPPRCVESFRHHFEDDDLVVDRLPAVRRGALGRRTAKCRQSAEAFRSRTAAYFSVQKGRPLLSLKGNSISTRCIILSALKTQTEDEQHRGRDRD
jgi:hypothetical protein